ncbi:MAG: hypothetical protein HXN00_00490 [Porphyromonadaceae bacterium]|nr:hypothetical protein [Porphyromonadaceae bacterium]
MTLEDLLYRLCDSIGWGLCDYAHDGDGAAYGITDGRATLAISLAGDTACWATYVTTPDGTDPLDEGECPVGDITPLVRAWREAAAIAMPHEARVARVVARLTGERWTHEQDDGTHILRGGHAVVTITPDGEVISDDPMARLYVHAVYAPEDYGVYPAA